MKTLKEIFGGVVKKTESNNLSLNNEHKGVQYRCPMGCEGDKRYDAPGNCPVCNMNLVSVSDSGSPSQVHEHGHEGHGHGHHGCC
jgi:hypothetical protein